MQSSFRFSSFAAGLRAQNSSSYSSLPGSKATINGQSLTSTGLQQFDTIIGGGCPIGGVVLIQGPLMASYASDALNYFITEGIVQNQATVIGNFRGLSNKQLVQEFPLELSTIKQAVENSDGESVCSVAPKLDIAWQYGKYATSSTTAKSSKSSRYCHSYNLSKSLQSELLKANEPNFLDVSGEFPSLYDQLLTDIECVVDDESSVKRVTRIALLDLASPDVFGPMDNLHRSALIKFLMRLRALVRSHAAVCMISVQHETLPELMRTTMGHYCDLVAQFDCLREIQLERDIPGELREFEGVCSIKKLPRLHSIACPVVDSRMFGIKRDRRKLQIEKLHLPPEETRSLGESSKSHSMASTAISSKTGCGSSHGTSPLDF